MIAYPAYKDSDISWLGTIPEHWAVKPLRAIFKIRNEKNNPVKTHQILSLSIAQGVTLYSDKGRGGNKAKEDLTAYKIAYPNDIVVNSMNVIVGAVGLSKYLGAISPVYYAIYLRSVHNNNINYYAKIFSNHKFQRYLSIYGKGILIKKTDSGKLNTIRMKISLEDFKKIVLPLPPIDEQIKIAKYLDWKTTKISRFIKAKKKLITLLKEQKQKIINEAVTKGINPNVKMKDSGFDWLGKVPDHWLIKKVRHFCTCQNGISESSDFFTDGFPFISYGDVYKNRVLPINVEGKAKSNEKQQINYSVKRGDIFFTRTSEVLDEIGITSVCFETIPNAIFSGFLIRVRPDAKIINEVFSKYYFQATCVREYFTKEMNIVTRASLGQNLLKNLPVLLPPFNEQIQIAEKLEIENNLIDRTISRAKKEIELIQEYQTRLISDVVTGKIDIRSIQVPDFESIEADIDLSDENVTEELVEDIEE